MGSQLIGGLTTAAGVAAAPLTGGASLLAALPVGISQLAQGSGGGKPPIIGGSAGGPLGGPMGGGQTPQFDFGGGTISPPAGGPIGGAAGAPTGGAIGGAPIGGIPPDLLLQLLRGRI